ncbi:DUF3576 domain-containing protein [Parasedimentitalea maritima]|uniref:DUF3576 domain-containing protein n=1 Tax=Parasedimentitalea maritima TaxID=2578117 RepID=A0ABY2UWE3_9RHOB|nr:DUF3576 domain-containing protein [Zongyanglinia marina]TLP65829.1 DUF3576 domain-containing protein [Zongyanglinia marina]
MRWLKVIGLFSLLTAISSCGMFNGKGKDDASTYSDNVVGGNPQDPEYHEGSTLWDILGPNDSEQTVQVNRYLWNASLDVLDFLPVQSVDPFTGVIITGFGTPPGGGRSYRATVHIKDPALDARSLNVSLHSKGGPVSASTTRAVEDAILSRARQLRIADKKF